MKRLLTVLGFCGAVVFLWCRTPAILVGYAPLGTGIYASKAEIFSGEIGGWCIPPEELHIWEPLPEAVAYIPMEWRSDWPDPDSLRVDIPVRSSSDSRQQLAAARRTWLGMAALQITLLALLLRRHRHLAGNIRSLTAWLRQHPAQIGLVALIFVAAILMVGLSSTYLGLEMDTFCHTRMDSDNPSLPAR